jgi:hypothetical protein
MKMKSSSDSKKTNPNKANLLDTQMNVSSVKTKDYENERLCRRGEKQTQSNPIYSEPVESISNVPLQKWGITRIIYLD